MNGENHRKADAFEDSSYERRRHSEIENWHVCFIKWHFHGSKILLENSLIARNVIILRFDGRQRWVRWKETRKITRIRDVLKAFCIIEHQTYGLALTGCTYACKKYQMYLFKIGSFFFQLSQGLCDLLNHRKNYFWISLRCAFWFELLPSWIQPRYSFIKFNNLAMQISTKTIITYYTCILFRKEYGAHAHVNFCISAFSWKTKPPICIFKCLSELVHMLCCTKSRLSTPNRNFIWFHSVLTGVT